MSLFDEMGLYNKALIYYDKALEIDKTQKTYQGNMY